MEWVLVKTMFSLAAVLGLMIAVVWIMKKTVYGRRQVNSSAVAIDVLGHRMLQPKRSIFVVRVADRILVLGVTEAGMERLTEIGDAETLRQVSGRKEEASGASFWSSVKQTAGFRGGVPFGLNLQQSFHAVLLGALGRKKEAVPDGAEGRE
ncbi:MAG TPA: flagellar biosynthetic protein FliO [Bacteroidota bacterium]|nr:flagellar biosynthetic protein FliO [Bacteroidota bacterium]